MQITRRDFIELAGSAAAFALADSLFGVPELNAQNMGGQPGSALNALADVALNTAQKAGASYADIRINRYRDQIVGMRTAMNIATRTVEQVPGANESQSFGFGVRVMVNGTWGFSSSPIVTKEEIARITNEAVAVARANAVLQKKPLKLVPVGKYVDKWTTPMKRSPFDVPIGEKLALLEKVNAEIKSVQGVFSAQSTIVCRSEDKFFASSEGSRIQQFIVQTYGQANAGAADRQRGVSRQRNYAPAPVTAGWEAIERVDLVGNGKRIGEECIEHLGAPPVTPGKKDLVLLCGNLALTIHESIGHATELDRILGYEANYAGTSFVKLADLGKLKYGSEVLNIVGDRTLPEGMATVGYDDDGVKAKSFDLIKNGTLVGLQTIRDQAAIVGESESRGFCYADSWSSIPFQRIPNVWLKPSEKETSLDDLIGMVDDGVLIDGRGSWSIDHQRYNFQFGGDAFWEIKGGKKGKMISRVAYQSRTTDFWGALAATGGKSIWTNQGLTSDGKGQPGQINAMSHGCAPSLFRQINVLLTD